MPLLVVHRRAKKNGAFDTYKSPARLLGARELAKMTFWQLDIVGVILVIACLALILVPLTIAHGVQSQWKTAKVIAPLVVGVCCVPAWIIWERSCKHPMMPFRVKICALNQKMPVVDITPAIERPGCLGCARNRYHVELSMGPARQLPVYGSCCQLRRVDNVCH